MNHLWFVLGFLAVSIGSYAGEAKPVEHNINNKYSLEQNTSEKSMPENNTSPQRHDWVELAVGSVVALEFKTSQSNRGWALAFSKYHGYEIFGNGKYNKNGDSIDDSSSDISLMRIFSRHGNWSYSSISAGIAYIEATEAKNCVRTGRALFIGDTYTCDEKHHKGLAIPIEFDIAVGRYTGIGLKTRFTIGSYSTVGIALTIPLGSFAK